TQLRDCGNHRRVETWENANLQASIFARHVMGVEHPKANPAWFWTDQLNINFQFVGDMAAAEWHIRGEMDAAKGADNSFVMYGVTDGQVGGRTNVNADKEMPDLKKMIRKNTAFDVEEQLDIAQGLRKIA